MTTTVPKLRIAAFRGIVDSLNWNRRDLSGATREEWLREDVRARLQRRIDKVQALLPSVPARFAEDLRHAGEAIASANVAIGRWQEARDVAASAGSIAQGGSVKTAPTPHLVRSNGLPVVDHLEADEFAARLEVGAIQLTSIGSENAYAVDAHGREFFAKAVSPACRAAHLLRATPLDRS